jgi:hypothetical protein
MMRCASPAQGMAAEDGQLQSGRWRPPRVPLAECHLHKSQAIET